MNIIRASRDKSLLHHTVETALEALESEYDFMFSHANIDGQIIEFMMGIDGVGDCAFYMDPEVNPDFYDYVNSGDIATAVEMLKSEIISEYVEDYGPIDTIHNVNSATNTSGISNKIQPITAEDNEGDRWLKEFYKAVEDKVSNDFQGMNWNSDDENVYLDVVTENDKVIQFTIPFDDLSFNFDNMDESVDYVVDEIKHSSEIANKVHKGLADVKSASLPDGSEYNPEDYAGGYTEWEKIASKPVRDSDGFMTEYTMWYNEFEDKYVFIFGDSDIYYPENSDFDWECEDYDEAVEWWNDYEGFEDDEIEECSDVKASIRRDNPVEWVDATFVVRKMYNKFPDFDFIDERDMGENVALYFKLGSDVPGVEEFLSKLGINYRISNGKLRIVVPEDQDYEEPGEYEEWGDSPVDECQSITSSSEVDLEPFVVRFGWDSGGPENGPSYGYGEDIVYAISREDACSRWESENQEQIEGFNSGEYGGYEGCFARPATKRDIKELEESKKYWDEIEKHYRFEDGDVYPIDECDSIKSSKEFYDMGTGLEYWYFTTHGVQPGSVPKGLEILDIIDKPEGCYFLTNRVISTDALKYYDIKERSPK